MNTEYQVQAGEYETATTEALIEGQTQAKARTVLLYTKSINEFINIFPGLDLAEIRCGYYLLSTNSKHLDSTNCWQNTLAFT